jgi:hypothetical protein
MPQNDRPAITAPILRADARGRLMGVDGRARHAAATWCRVGASACVLCDLGLTNDIDQWPYPFDPVQKSPSLTVVEIWLSTVVSTVALAVSKTIGFR